jgi:hypothetical protein
VAALTSIQCNPATQILCPFSAFPLFKFIP